jgi:hypothetical protein
MSPDKQDDYLRSLQGDGKNVGAVPSEIFFGQLFEATLESDPTSAEWRMIGFPGAYASFFDLVDPTRDHDHPRARTASSSVSIGYLSAIRASSSLLDMAFRKCGSRSAAENDRSSVPASSDVQTYVEGTTATRTKPIGTRWPAARTGSRGL